MYGKNLNLTICLFSCKFKDKIDNFDCGSQTINEYLYEADIKNEDGEGVTYLVINKDNEDIIAYYTLSASSLLYKVDKYIRGFSALEIKMFAVNVAYQNMWYTENKEDGVLSDYILADIITQIYNMSEKKIGIKFITLYSVPDAKDFYIRNGFESINEFILPIFDVFTEGCDYMIFRL